MKSAVDLVNHQIDDKIAEIHFRRVQGSPYMKGSFNSLTQQLRSTRGVLVPRHILWTAQIWALT